MSPQRSPLVGRAAELAVLHAGLAGARTGSGDTVLVSGEAGIGKTRLVTELLDAAGPDVLVARGQCADSGTGPVPYSGLDGILRDLVTALGSATVLEAAGPAADALGAVAPALVEVRQDVGAGRAPEAVTDLLVALGADRTVIVVLEDLHWSDDVTRSTLARLARAAGSASLLVLATYRSDDVDRRHPLRATLAELDRARLVTRVEVPRLEAGQVVELARAVPDDAPLGARALQDVVERSEGVPFYVEELAAYRGLELPTSLRDVLLLRYTLLSARAQEICRVVAAAGSRVRHDTLAAVVGDAALADAEGALREAVDALVLVTDDDGYRFRHALTQEAVDAELLPGEQRRLHTAYAEHLAGGASTVQRLAEVADHWWRARVPDRALAAAVRAQHAATQSGNATTAVRLAERALEAWDLVPDPEQVAGITHAEMLRRAAEAQQTATRVDRALALARGALAEWPAEDPSGRAAVLGLISILQLRSGDPDGRHSLEEALRVVPAADLATVATLQRARARASMLAGEYEQAVTAAAASYDAAMAVDDTATASAALNTHAMARLHQGDLEALQELERARGLAGDAWTAIGRYFTNASDAHVRLGRYDRALQIGEAGAEQARRHGAGWDYRAMLEGNVAEAMIGLGRWDEADTWYRRSVPLVRASIYAVYLSERWTWLTFWRGDVESAQAAAHAHRATWLRYAQIEMQVRSRVTGTLAELALARGDLDDALSLVTDVAEPGRLAGDYALPVLAVAARVLARAQAEGRHVDLAPYREALARASTWPTHRVWAALFHAELGESSWPAVAQLGVDDGAPAHLRPYALLRHGESLLGAGQVGRAREELAAAVEEAAAIGAGTVRSRATALLDDVGPSTPRHVAGSGVAPSGLDSLTDRERQVLDLVADGLTNGQVAERLYITRKTVSVHVSAILRKLGVASRTEAAVRLRSGASGGGS
ncbi:helix-turn-helix transcriptional regulator [Isoptericola aurantiacus]|uniref:helix-turn-helix transcriptional regulator n=1 Tax=Isoptericola aurantiacus TaxID=3377839 RepID=UPI003839EDAF